MNKKEIYGVIYLLTNTINQKVYVGQTVISRKHKRPYEHFNGSSKENSYLRNAIKKYGKEVFTISYIRDCYSLDHLNKSETYFIVTKYKSYLRENGYNLRSGGGNRGKDITGEITKKARRSRILNHMKRKGLHIKDIKNIYEEYLLGHDTIEVIYKKYNLSRQTILSLFKFIRVNYKGRISSARANSFTKEKINELHYQYINKIKTIKELAYDMKISSMLLINLFKSNGLEYKGRLMNPMEKLIGDLHPRAIVFSTRQKQFIVELRNCGVDIQTIADIFNGYYKDYVNRGTIDNFLDRYSKQNNYTFPEITMHKRIEDDIEEERKEKISETMTNNWKSPKFRKSQAHKFKSGNDHHNSIKFSNKENDWIIKERLKVRSARDIAKDFNKKFNRSDVEKHTIERQLNRLEEERGIKLSLDVKLQPKGVNGNKFTEKQIEYIINKTQNEHFYRKKLITEFNKKFGTDIKHSDSFERVLRENNLDFTEESKELCNQDLAEKRRQSAQERWNTGNRDTIGRVAA